MINVENMLNDDEFFGDIVDTPKEGIEQHKKWECLKGAIDKGKLGHTRTALNLAREYYGDKNFKRMKNVEKMKKQQQNEMKIQK